MAERKLALPSVSVVGGVALIAALLVPLLVRSPYYIELGVQIGFYMVLAVGLNMVVGFCGLLDLGYAAFFAIGAYTTGILMSRLHFSFWLCLPFCIVNAALAGVMVGGRPCASGATTWPSSPWVSGRSFSSWQRTWPLPVGPPEFLAFLRSGWARTQSLIWSAFIT